MIHTVIFLETSARMGGTETVLSRLMNGMRKDRFRPVLCCLFEPGVIGEKLMAQGHPVVHSLGLGPLDPRIPWRLFLLLRRRKVSVLFIVNQPLTQFWGVLCGLLAGVPVRIAAIRSTGKINRIKRRLFINNLTFPWMTRVTGLSEMHKKYLIDVEGIEASKIEVVPNGVDLARFRRPVDGAKLRAELRIPEGALVVGIVAMLRPEKNHVMFLKAAAEVARVVPNAVFVLVGDGSERKKLEGLARSLSVEGAVRFAGLREDVPDLLQIFDVAVLSSFPIVETLSNAVLEYMAAGKPVVATRVGSVPEQVVDGQTGYLVEPDDARAMADRLIGLLKNEGLRRRFGEAGLARVKERYTIERMIHETESLFERLLAETEKPR